MKYIGKGIPGKTNQVLAAGKGTFVGDISMPGMCHLAVVRSPYAHARIKSIDTSAADRLPGVITTITGEEIVRKTKPIPTHSSALGEKKFLIYALAVDKARYVGEPVAAVVAEDRFIAKRSGRTDQRHLRGFAAGCRSREGARGGQHTGSRRLGRQYPEFQD